MKLLTTLLLLVAIHVNAQVVAIEKLNSDLQKTNSGWLAKDNWLNHLSTAELKRMMGARNVNPSPVEFSTDISTQGAEIFDWRDQKGVNFVSPILNQGNCGSCVAFATIGTLETQMNIATGLAFLNNHYSPEALFACGGGGCAEGWMPGSAVQYLQATGVPDEACAPYTMGATGNDVSCSSICKDAASRSQKISTFSSPSSMTDVKNALKKGPLITTLYVYADFISYSSGVYKHRTGGPLGGHAVSLIGFDDTKNAWIIRNSWGPDWGINGFGYVSYDDTSGVGQDNEALQVTASSEQLYTDLRDRAFVSGNTQFKVQSTFKSAQPITVSIIDENTKALKGINCTGTDCALSVSTADLADGKYEFVATSGSEQLHRYFYVSNHSEKINLAVKAENFTAQAPVSDRIVIDVTLSSDGKVPLQQIALVYQDSTGTVKERWTDSVADQMSIGWRTNMVPNGAYKVWIRARTFASGQVQTIDSTAWNLNIQN